MNEKRLYLIDATAFCYRAFYAIRGLSTSFGQPTNAVFGFTAMLNKIIKDKQPGYLGVCFDVSRETFRQKKFAEYKLQRPPMPDGLSSQIPLIRKIVSAYGFPIVEKEGFEADDVIATLARKAGEAGFAVTIISSDKDVLQLVNDRTLVLNPGRDEETLYDSRKVMERFGVAPERIADVLSLMGDTIDNIPGVPGVGEKTAVQLIKEFGSLEQLLERTGDVKQEKIRAAIRGYVERLRLNKELITLHANVEIDAGPQDLAVGRPDYRELFRLFKTLEFKKLLRELPAEELSDETPQKGGEQHGDAGLFAAGQEAGEVCVYGTPEALAINVAGKTFCLEELTPQARELLADARVKKIGFDLKRLAVALGHKGIGLEGIFFDVMIADYVVNASRSSYTLADAVWEHLGEPCPEGEIPGPRAIERIMQLRPRLEEKMQERSLVRLFREIEMPLVGVLTAMELTGIKLDTAMLAQLSRRMETRLTALIEEIYAVSGCQFNINSPKQLRDVLFTRLGLPVVKRTKTGPSTDEEVLHALAGTHKLPALLLEYRQLTKLKSTYVDALPLLINPRTGRVHSSFHQTGTETGRLSSANPNLQNVPVKTDIGRMIRQAIVPFDSGECLLSCDYSQIELRILAHFSGDANLISAFQSGKDVHRATAALIYGTPESGVTDQMRETAKRVNFGIIYGLTPFGLARDLGISIEEAGQFIDAYFLRYPGVKEYMQQQIARAEEDGFVTTLSGRRRYLPDITSKNQAVRQFAQRQAVNTPIQGSASDLIKLAMIRIHDEIKKESPAAQMILQVHDELLFNVGAKQADEFAESVRVHMEQVLPLRVPVKVGIKKGNNWLDMEELQLHPRQQRAEE